jgi:L-2-hydroxycarboxylate dehydrogenase (NAD+)
MIDATTRHVPAASLEPFAASILTAAGVERDEAELIAGYLVEANLRGVDGHGVMRLTQYVESIEGGGINLSPQVRVVRQHGATAMVDADGGYGFRPAREAMELAVGLAATWGIGCVGVANSHHFGMALFSSLRAAEQGYVGITISNTTAVMPAPGGLTSVVGNAPIAIAVPRDDAPPLAVDLALSQASWGTISLAAGRGSAIPLGWALDRDGEETTDAQRALEANLLVPIGGHKGFALAVLLELLAAGLTDSPIGPAANTHGDPSGGCGHLVIAIDADRFGGRRAFSERVEGFAASIVQSHAKDGVVTRLPGDRGITTRARRLNDGVPIEDDVAVGLNALALRFGVTPI